MKKSIPNTDELRAQLKDYLIQLAPETNKSQLDELVAEFKPNVFPKKYFLLEAGEFSENIYFICSGLVRNYYIKEGKEISHWISKENSLLAAAYSIATGDKNFINYESLEETTVLQIKYSTLLSYYAKYHSLEHLGRRIVELYYAAFMQNSYNVLFLSAEERYEQFKKENEDLLNRVPLRIIASFLGITQETLSRLRAKQ